MIIRRNIYKNIYCSETIRRHPFSSWCDKFAQLVFDVMKINQCANKIDFFMFTQNLFIYFHILTEPIHKYEKLLKAFLNAPNRL